MPKEKEKPIIAILENRLGFRKTMYLPYPMNVVYLSDIVPLSVQDITETNTFYEPTKMERIEFYFIKWISKKEGIALYKEE